MKIVLSIILALFIAGCGGSTTQEEVQKKVVAQEKAPVEPKPAPTVAQVKEDAIEVAANSVEIVKEEISKVVDATKNATNSAVPTIDAKVLYNGCAGCHGTSGEKKALGKSQIIKGWSVEKTITALNGYKDGTYGGAMKTLMKGQASKLSSDEIKAIAEYISKL